jgi:hypothetical protein
MVREIACIYGIPIYIGYNVRIYCLAGGTMIDNDKAQRNFFDEGLRGVYKIIIIIII